MKTLFARALALLILVAATGTVLHAQVPQLINYLLQARINNDEDFVVCDLQTFSFLHVHS